MANSSRRTAEMEDPETNVISRRHVHGDATFDGAKGTLLVVRADLEYG